LVRSGDTPHPREDFAEVRPGQYCGGRAVFADRHRYCAVAKGPQLRTAAALSLAKLYREANRDVDAHAVLAPAVEGFPPTRQFPELTEAQALLAAFSESDAVERACARELPSQVEDLLERFSVYYSLWGGHLTRGEPAPMREMAELFLREAQPSRIAPRP